MSEKATRLYEFGFILVPTIAETEVPEKVLYLKSLISKVDGTISSEGAPEFIDLAYTMEKTLGSKKYKYSQGYFGFIKFESAPEALELLKKSLDAETDLVRYILLKTDQANTISFKKPKIEAKRDSDISEDDMNEDDISAHESLPELSEDVDVEAEASVKESE